MAITGTGTQQDPYVVTTYAELVSKASESGKFIRIGNDINITDEYPDGNMPTLNVSASIDGNNKKIYNWYKTNGSIITFSGSSSQIHDCTLANLYQSGNEAIVFSGRNQDYHIVDCNIYGIVEILMEAIDDYGSLYNFLRCSVNVKTTSVYHGIVSSHFSYIGMKDCCIRVTSKRSAGVFDTSRSTFVDSCYIEADIPCGCYASISNSVLDITTSAVFTANGDSGNALCIFNSDHAPNGTAGNGFASVDSTHWLDIAYLSSIGFNAG